MRVLGRLVVLAAVSLAVLTCVSAVSAAAPRWQRGPGFIDFGLPVWGAGRVWFLVPEPSFAPDGLKFVGASALVRDGGLGAWRAVPSRTVGDIGWTSQGLFGDRLAFQSGHDIDVTKWRVFAVGLLAGGAVGDAVEISGGAPPPASSLGAAFVQLPDRTVQLVGFYNERHEMYPDPGACCDVNGRPVNYVALTGWSPVDLQLGLDRQGRLWLVWGKLSRGSNRIQIVQLDAQTLNPVGMPTAIPGSARGSIQAVVCTDTCRVLMWGREPLRVSCRLCGLSLGLLA